MLNKDEIIKAKILEGADKLFQKYGLGKTTMEDIAKDAGKGKSTLYYYFKSKEEIKKGIELAMANGAAGVSFFGKVDAGVLEILQSVT